MMRELGAVEKRLRRTLVELIERECSNGKDAEEVAAELMGAWREYQRQGRYLRYTVGARKFFATGLWHKDVDWPFDESRMRLAQEAAMGAR